MWAEVEPRQPNACVWRQRQQAAAVERGAVFVARCEVFAAPCGRQGVGVVSSQSRYVAPLPAGALLSLHLLLLLLLHLFLFLFLLQFVTWCLCGPCLRAGLLASGGGTADRCIRFWNTTTGTPLHWVDTGSQVCNIAWSRSVDEVCPAQVHGVPPF